MKEDMLKQRSGTLDVVLFISLIAGITAGVLISLRLDGNMLISLSGTEKKLSMAGAGKLLIIALRSFGGTGILLCAAFLLGFSALSQPLEILLSAFRGLGLGLCVRGVYLGGNVARSLSAFLPFSVLSTALLILTLREAFGMSSRYLSLSLTSENRLGIRNELRDYICKFLIYTVLLAILSLTDSVWAGYLGKGL